MFDEVDINVDPVGATDRYASLELLSRSKPGWHSAFLISRTQIVVIEGAVTVCVGSGALRGL